MRTCPQGLWQRNSSGFIALCLNFPPATSTGYSAGGSQLEEEVICAAAEGSERPRRPCSTDTADCRLQPPCGQCLPWRQKGAQLLMPTSTHPYSSSWGNLTAEHKKTMGITVPTPYAAQTSSCTTVYRWVPNDTLNCEDRCSCHHIQYKLPLCLSPD